MSVQADALSGHGAPAVHAEDPIAARSNMLLAVKLAILSEIMLFGALFAAYFVIRGASGEWPPANGPERPELVLPGLNTMLLILSSGTMQLGVRAARRGDRSRILRWLGLTLLLGGIFIVVQGYEFATNGFGLGSGIFGSTFLHPHRVPRRPCPRGLGVDRHRGQPGPPRARVGRAPYRRRGQQLLLAFRRRCVAIPLLDRLRPLTSWLRSRVRVRCAASRWPERCA